jgi:dihydroorotate dehydrogenase
MNGIRESFYEAALKPFFFKLSPENAHELSKGLLDLADKIPFFFPTLEKLTSYESERLKTKVSNIEFKNPLGMAAGFDKTGELYPFLSRLGFGFVEVGTITAFGQDGNPKPRLFRYEKESALVNRLGFNNPGSEKAYHTLHSQTRKIPRGINVGKTKITPIEKTVEDYSTSLKKLSPISDYALINISSPNTPGLRGFQEKESFIELIEGIKKSLGGKFSIPTYIKLAPDLEDSAIEELLEIVLSLQLDGVVLTNTTINPSVLKNTSNIETGGISGKPLRMRSTDVIKLAYKKLQGRIPIIGVGGIDSFEAALEKIFSGANLIQIYTGYVYKGPFLPYMILEGLDLYLNRFGIKNISEIVGQKDLRV